MSESNGIHLPGDLDRLPFTPVQRRMMKLFCDYKPHTKEEVYACLTDDLALGRAIHAHLTAIRKLLPEGFILSVHRGQVARVYQLFKVVPV